MKYALFCHGYNNTYEDMYPYLCMYVSAGTRLYIPNIHMYNNGFHLSTNI